MDDWGDRFARALDAGDGQTARRMAAGVADDRGRRDDALDLLASRAADGTSLAMEVLAQLVDESGLARAGVRRVLVAEAEVDDVTQDTLDDRGLAGRHGPRTARQRGLAALASQAAGLWLIDGWIRARSSVARPHVAHDPR